tara:strand:+ start:330 stop:1046 length:717 start_codon:yes stop_codon:yes gene_type:complete
MSLYNYIGNFPAQSSSTGNRGILSMPEHYDLKSKSNLSDPLPPTPAGMTLKFYLDAKNTQSYSGSGTTWSDLTQNANDFSITSPSYNSNGYFNLSDSASTNITRSGVLGESDMTVFFLMSTTDGQSLMIHDGGGAYLGAYRSGAKYYHAQVSGNKGLYVNTNARNNLYDYIRTGSFLLITISDCDFHSTNFNDYQFNAYGSYQFGNGSLRALGAYNGNFSSSDVTTLYNWFNEKGYFS